MSPDTFRRHEYIEGGRISAELASAAVMRSQLSLNSSHTINMRACLSLFGFHWRVISNV